MEKVGELMDLWYQERGKAGRKQHDSVVKERPCVTVW